MRILVTGSNGFVGRALMVRLAQDLSIAPIGGVRDKAHLVDDGQSRVLCPNLDPNSDWSRCVVGVDVIIHCAARAHILSDEVSKPLEAFRRVNTAGTLALAEQAAAAGVKHFVFVSSIGVNGAATFGVPFDENQPEAPNTPYAVSKREAEIGLFSLSQRSSMTVSVVRPPLVYGANAPGNLRRLAGLIRRGLPLPFASIDNRRTLVSVNNLADLLVHCALKPAAVGEVFLAGDEVDVSTAEIVNHIGRSIGRPARLLPFPPQLLDAMLRMVGKGAMAQQLIGSLQVDISKAQNLLGWKPLEMPDAALWA